MGGNCHRVTNVRLAFNWVENVKVTYDWNVSCPGGISSSPLFSTDLKTLLSEIYVCLLSNYQLNMIELTIFMLSTITMKRISEGKIVSMFSFDSVIRYHSISDFI